MKRYDHDGVAYSGMCEAKDGEYVLYADVADLQKKLNAMARKCARLEKEVKELRLYDRRPSDDMGR